jgi:hypothetical protein
MPSARRNEQVRRYFEYSESGVEVEEDGLKEIPFGEFLVERGVLSRSQLFQVLTHQDKSPGIRIGEIVSALGFVPYSTVDKLLTEFHRIPQVEIGV